MNVSSTLPTTALLFLISSLSFVINIFLAYFPLFMKKDQLMV